MLNDNIILKRSQRTHRPKFSDDYIVYLQEHKFNAGMFLDPAFFKEAINSSQSSCWMDALLDEMASICHRYVKTTYET